MIIGWASTYLHKAGLIDKPRRDYVRITDRGLTVLADNPEIIDDRYLQRFEEYRDFKQVPTSSPDNLQSETASPQHPVTPDELIGAAYTTLEAELRDDLLERIKQVDPAAFEWLVLQLLHAMGYGGSIQDVEGVPRGPDGGIDGTIEEDRLGLDVIYVQAKRWQGSVGRSNIQAFQGALAGVGARKGVFITTSHFTSKAIDYVRQLRDSRIILIDGKQLAQLAIEHDIGVSVRATFTIERVDEDFFSELDSSY